MSLEENRAEVKDMLLTEYDEAKQIELFREEGREIGYREGWEIGYREGWEIGYREGWEKGRAEGILSVLTALVRDGMLSLKEEAARSRLSLEEFRKELG